MDNLDQITEIEQQYHQLVSDGAYAQALELVTRTAHLFPDYSQKIVYAWRMIMACRLHKRELALELLQEAIAAGHWYTGLAEDDDFSILQGNPEFERLLGICVERRAQAMAEAVPVMKVIRPEGYTAPYPLLFALHGNQSNLAEFAGHWMAATEHGWLVGLPQSSQPFGPGTFSWNDWDWSLQEVQAHFALLCSQYPIDPQRVVLAGFSMGGGLAAWLALSGAISPRGLLLVNPFLSDVNHLVPILKAYHPQELRVYIGAGQRDAYCLGVAQQLAALLPKYSIICELEIFPDLEHNFPQQLESSLPNVLEGLLG